MFFELIRIAIGRQERLRTTPTAEEWEVAYDLAQRQTLTGIAFCGVQRLPEEQRPPRMLLMKWYMTAEQIRRKNEKMDRMTVAVAKKFAENGFPGLVLKGQGVAQLYRVEQIENSKLKIDNGHPEGDARENDNDNENQGAGKFSILNSQFSIKEYRTPGDIDIWLHGERKDILDYVRRHVPDCKPVYHHVDFPVIDELPIEVHFTPSWMNSPFTNRRLQDFFKRGTINVERGTGNDERGTWNEKTAEGCTKTITKTKTNKNLWSSAESVSSVCHNNENCHPDGTVPSSRGTPTRSISVGCDDGAFRVPKESLAEGVTLNSQPSSLDPQPSKSAASLTGTEGAYSRSAASFTGTEGAPILPTPTLAFNRVYILVHIYRHLFHEGIGLRQLLDYYFVLQQGFTEEERTETMRTLRSLRMQRFTEAVMWVLQEVFAMDERYLLTTPNEEEGRFLLSEIMMAGNFGHYDERIKRSEKVTEWDLFRRRVGRNMRFVRSYPSEVLWAPLFKLWHAGFRFVNRNR